MKKTISYVIVLSALMIFSCQSAETNVCAEHQKNCPLDENCSRHPDCEAHEKCEKEKDCKEHPKCEAFENQLSK